MAHVQKNSKSAVERTNIPKCLDLLITLWGHTPHDRGSLLSSSGHHCERTPSNASHDNPHDISPDPVGVQSVGQSSKRSTRDYSINSPPSKKSASINECLNDQTNIIKDHKLQKVCISKQEEEMDKVVKIMKEDGVEEIDDVYTQVL